MRSVAAGAVGAGVPAPTVAAIEDAVAEERLRRADPDHVALTPAHLLQLL